MAVPQKFGIAGLCLAAATWLASMIWPPLAYPTERTQLQWVDARITVPPMLVGLVVAGERQTRNGGVLLTLGDQDGKEFNARIKHVFTLLDQDAIDEILALSVGTQVSIARWPADDDRIWALSADGRQLLDWEHAAAVEPVRVLTVQGAIRFIALLLALTGSALLAAGWVRRNRGTATA